jgi:hypothetical protein
MWDHAVLSFEAVRRDGRDRSDVNLAKNLLAGWEVGSSG